MMQAAAPATYTKLRNGSWGIRVSGTGIRVGEQIVVVKRDGSSKDETVAAIVWSGNGVTLCAIGASAPRTTGRSYRYGSGAGRAASVAGSSSYCTGRDGCRCFDCAD